MHKTLLNFLTIFFFLVFVCQLLHDISCHLKMWIFCKRITIILIYSITSDWWEIDLEWFVWWHHLFWHIIEGGNLIGFEVIYKIVHALDVITPLSSNTVCNKLDNDHPTLHRPNGDDHMFVNRPFAIQFFTWKAWSGLNANLWLLRCTIFSVIEDELAHRSNWNWMNAGSASAIATTSIDYSSSHCTTISVHRQIKI